MGFLTGLSLKTWLYVGIALVIAGLTVAVKVQTSRLDTCKTSFEAFKATVKAEGEAAAKEAARVNLANQKGMEAANAKIKVLLADNGSLGKRLRDARSNSGFLPKPAADSPSPDRACFGRAELESALQRLDAGVSLLIGEGDQAKLKLSTAAEWAASVGAR